MSRLDRHAYNWHSMLALRDQVIKDMKDWSPDIVYGVEMGGIVPATLVAKELRHDQIGLMKLDNLGIPIPVPIPVDSILIVDDIVDTGDTMKSLVDFYQYHYPELDIRTAGYIYKSHTSTHKPDYYGMETESNEWVVFPWEKDWVEVTENEKENTRQRTN